MNRKCVLCDIRLMAVIDWLFRGVDFSIVFSLLSRNIFVTDKYCAIKFYEGVNQLGRKMCRIIVNCCSKSLICYVNNGDFFARQLVHPLFLTMPASAVNQNVAFSPFFTGKRQNCIGVYLQGVIDTSPTNNHRTHTHIIIDIISINFIAKGKWKRAFADVYLKRT
jgi:hypothetical protein